MKGLLLKDLFILKKQTRFFMILLVFYIVFGLAVKEIAAFCSMVVIMCAMLPMTVMAYDERAKWDQFVLSTPASRRDVVLSKYILGILLGVAAIIIVTLFGLAGGPEQWKDTLEAALTTGAAGLILLSILLPVFFRFGVERGRLIMLAFILAPVVLSLLLSRLSPDFSRILEELLTRTPWLLGIAAAVCLAISFAISLAIYRKKEF